MPKHKPYPTIGLQLCLALLSTLSAGCTVVDEATPVVRATATPTNTPIALVTGPIILTPTAPPTESRATPSATPTLRPTATATLKPAAITSQGDRIPRSFQGDTLLPTPNPIHNLSSGILCSVNGGALNLREGPGMNYTVITTLPLGAFVSARKCYPGAEWLLVETTKKEIGWASSALLSCQSDPATLPVANFTTVQASPRPAATIAPTSPPLASTNEDDVEDQSVSLLPPPTLDTWQAEYFDNASLIGDPVLIRPEPELDFNWILDSPAPNIPADNFSARWTRLFDFVEGGDYRFFADADDGVRLYVDGWLVIDEWNTSQPVTHFGDFAGIKPGLHTLTVEYFESGGHANIKVWAEKTTFTDDRWRGEYYNNPDLRDPAVLVRQDEIIDFDWGNGSPAAGIDGNDFSVRWERTLYFDQGDYRFYAKIAGRERVKIYLDGWLLVDKYRDSGGTVEGYFADVGAGPHTVRVEYQEDSGRAKIRVWWERAS